MSAWQNIETAPKDGWAIWACDAERLRDAKAGCNPQGEWECIDMDGNFMGVGFYPTHWQPLPEPPSNRATVNSSLRGRI